jgi:cell division protein FtsL
MARAATAKKAPPRRPAARNAAAGRRRAGGRAAATHRSAPRRSAPARRNPRSAAARHPSRAARSPRVAAGGTVALPLGVRVLRAPITRALRARGSRALDALLAGQGWIVVIGVLLAGIVFVNVYLLELNRDIAATYERAAAVKRENARLRLEVARLGSSERIQEAAAALGLVLPAPGEVRYLKANPKLDGRRAAKRVEPPGLVETPAPVVPEPVTPEPVVPETTAPEPVAPVSTTPPSDPTATDPAAADPAAG